MKDNRKEQRENDTNIFFLFGITLISSHEEVNFLHYSIKSDRVSIFLKKNRYSFCFFKNQKFVALFTRFDRVLIILL